MKTLKIFLLCISVSILSITCTKEHLSTTSPAGSPVFYFKGTVGGTAVNLQAGINNYYMYSSYIQDNSDVYNYIGNLKEFNCNSGCASSIEFIINDYRTRNTGAAETHIADSSLVVSNYSYLASGGTPTADSVTFTPKLGSGTPVRYTYNFGDNTTLSDSGTPGKSITHVYTHPGNYNASLTVTYSGGHTESSNSAPIVSSVTGSLYQIAITDTLINQSPYTHDYNVISPGISPTSYSWTYGASTSNSNLLTNITYPAPGIYKVSLKVADNSGHTASASINSADDSADAQYVTNLNSNVSAPTPNTLGLSNVTILYTDPTGDVYTSSYTSQSDSSNFQIVSVTPYNKNENNEATKQLHVKFNCTLYDNTGKSLIINNGDAVIAVAYK